MNRSVLLGLLRLLLLRSLLELECALLLLGLLVLLGR